MLKTYLENVSRFCREKNRWWLPIITGIFYSIALPPFNHETHWIFSLFPLLNFLILIPLFGFAVDSSFKRSLVYMYLYGYLAAFGQYHWLIFDRVEGLWGLVILGLFLACAVVAGFYLVAGILFRFVDRYLGSLSVIAYPALWVLIDYSRTLGEMAFPWAFLGYSFTPILPFSQLASVTGVWGLTYLSVMGNVIIWFALRNIRQGKSFPSALRIPLLFSGLLIAISITGWVRLERHPRSGAPCKTVALLQANIDQFRWSNAMLDTAFAVSESLAFAAAHDRADVMILPESALLCYINHRMTYRERVLNWVRKTRTPLIFGSIDLREAAAGSNHEYFVYNTAFFVDADALSLKPYYKNRLVPFSEALPFEGLFPVLSRVNLGEADFQRGMDPTIFSVKDGLSIAPFICYESIFPDYVRTRLRNGAHLIVNITNDGWFGRSSGPRHHAMMARMRSIENGVSLARCANSGISMVVDPLGRLLGETKLYERTILTRAVPMYTLPTGYSRFGDWFISLSIFLVFLSVAFKCVAAKSSRQF
jgi:apolipoprotein N-acyltransferase